MKVEGASRVDAPESGGPTVIINFSTVGAVGCCHRIRSGCIQAIRDTPTRLRYIFFAHWEYQPVSAIKGRKQRRNDHRPLVLIQARVPDDIHADLHEAARLSGVSVSVYIETLLTRLKLADEDVFAQLRSGSGTLPGFPELAHSQQEELPIPAT